MLAPAKSPLPGKLVKPFGSLAGEVAAVAQNRRVPGALTAGPSTRKPRAFPNKFPPPVGRSPAPSGASPSVPPTSKVISDIAARVRTPKCASRGKNLPQSSPPPLVAKHQPLVNVYPNASVRAQNSKPALPSATVASSLPVASEEQSQIPNISSAPVPEVALATQVEMSQSREPPPAEEQHIEQEQERVEEEIFHLLPPPSPPHTMSSATAPSKLSTAGGEQVVRTRNFGTWSVSCTSCEEEDQRSSDNIETAVNILDNATGDSTAAGSNGLLHLSATASREQESLSSHKVMSDKVKTSVCMAGPPRLLEKRALVAWSSTVETPVTRTPIARVGVVDPAGSGVPPVLVISVPKTAMSASQAPGQGCPVITLSQTVYGEMEQHQVPLQVFQSNRHSVSQPVVQQRNELPKHVMGRVMSTNRQRMPTIHEQGAVPIVRHTDRTGSEKSSTESYGVIMNEGAMAPANIAGYTEVPPEQVIRLVKTSPVSKATVASYIKASKQLLQQVDASTETNPLPADAVLKEDRGNQTWELSLAASNARSGAQHRSPVAGKSLVPNMNGIKPHALVAGAIVGILLLMVMVYMAGISSHSRKFVTASTRDEMEALLPREIGDSRQIYRFREPTKDVPYWNL